jgi:type VI secretion system secreted protein VgrG
MPSPKSGKPGKAVAPAAPNKAEDADIADPGKIAEIKAEQVENKSGKYGSEKVKPFKPSTEEENKEELSWIEIEMVDEEDEPVPGEKYKITLPDDSVAEGTLDEKGCARVEGFEKGTCKVCFSDLDAEAWEKI